MVITRERERDEREKKRKVNKKRGEGAESKKAKECWATDHDRVLSPIVDVDFAQPAEDLLELEFVEQGDHLNRHLYDDTHVSLCVCVFMVSHRKLTHRPAGGNVPLRRTLGVNVQVGVPRSRACASCCTGRSTR